MRISNHTGDLAFTPATGKRLQWNELPARIRDELEGQLGSQVREAVTQPGGFSPGVAARLRLANGRRVFVKAVSSRTNPHSPAMHRREAGIAAALPESVPTPRLLGSYDDGDWVALFFEDIEGNPPAIPWRRDELCRVLAAVTDLTTTLTPAPIAVEPVHEVSLDTFRGWQRLKSAAGRGEDDLRDVDPWVAQHLDDLAELELGAPAAAAGETMLHCDIRADNVLLTPSKVFFVDWPWASLGTAWVDLLFMLPSVAMQRGPKPWEIFETHPLGRNAPERDATAVVAAICGFFIHHSRLPPPPGLPTVRAFQRDQGVYALEWLKRRTGWR